MGQIWECPYYPTTSKAGELFLLIGITFNVFLMQKDLALAGSFADFLHRSNLAFNRPTGRRSTYIAAPSQNVDQQSSTNRSNGATIGDLEMTLTKPPTANEEESRI